MFGQQTADRAKLACYIFNGTFATTDERVCVILFSVESRMFGTSSHTLSAHVSFAYQICIHIV